MKVIKQISIAIVSDLHCTSSDDRKISHLMSHSLRSPKLQHPVEALKILIEKCQIKADIVLCPGDITDKIDLTGFNIGWAYVEEIGRELKSDIVIASLGNHDLDSRGCKSQGEPMYSAKNLNDSYPFVGNTNKYWTEHFELIDRDDIAILNINSSASHLRPKIDKEKNIVEFETSLDETTMEKIFNSIENLDHKKFKIALLHHHPSQYSDLVLSSYKERDILQGGDILLRALQSKSFDIVVHGHKHVPRFIIENNLPVFCSGSFASLLNLQESNSKNTFHILNLMRFENGNGNEENAGELFTWEFTKGLGWAKTTDLNSKIAHRIGFGLNSDLNQLSHDIHSYAQAEALSIIGLNELQLVFTTLKYLAPVYMESVFRILRQDYGYSRGMDENGSIILIKKRDG